jgi:hypothetical protein
MVQSAIAWKALLLGLIAVSVSAAQAADLKKKLAMPVTIKGEDRNTPFKEVVDYLGARFGLTIKIDRQAFQREGLGEVDQAPIKLRAEKNASLGQVLQRVLDQVKGTYRLKDNEILIVPAVKPKV